MSSRTEIANLAIAHLGIGKQIENLDSENSEEAQACRQFYNISRQATLRDFPWPFATKTAKLQLVEEQPNEEWAYSYRYPVDCMKARRIWSGLRNDSRQTRSPYRIVKDNEGVLIYSDEREATLEYTQDVTDTSFFDADFTLALSYRIAHYIVPRVAKGDPFGARQTTMDQYMAEITRARANAVNEQQDEEKPFSEFDRVRPSDYERSRT